MTQELMESMNEVALSKLNSLKDLPSGSKEEMAEVDAIVKLSGQINDAYKADADYDQKLKEIDLEKQKAADEKKDRRLNWGIQALVSALSTFVTIKMMKVCLRFEETGTMSSPVTKGLLSKIIRF